MCVCVLGFCVDDCVHGCLWFLLLIIFLSFPVSFLPLTTIFTVVVFFFSFLYRLKFQVGMLARYRHGRWCFRSPVVVGG
ncbi:hypothetical protein, unlikely [Trypanosoma brucei brucei TREU927]|uniref:Uncharacterized protein n=1 Tax=Trypanosoma brucei brucei (strain 927/4 GUTat10.1) TaxID=185431 RepID=Q38E50_TRYB2|nr:hypothetical protein, unlikely [Trypanosoma brucei brucei TREU927]EAN76920.1 hypothetical protein, unlikely [Trypanosoma brucei brucei TREU927]